MARNFSDILRVVGKSQIPFVAFTTNGLLLNEENIQEIISAGVKEIYVSFDGATQGTFGAIRGGASIQKVMKNIRLINHIKQLHSTPTPRVELHITLMRSNIEEVEGIIEIAHSLQISRVTALHFHAFPQLNLDSESLHNHTDISDTCLERARKRAAELNVKFDCPPAFKQAKPAPTRIRPNPTKQVCVLPWTSVVIRHDGDVFPCGVWYDGEPFGNLTKSSFSEVWYGPKYQALRTEMREHKLQSVCGRCEQCCG